jgi:hypothetical protein
MSRSYRRPYAAITGVQSASRDKQQASRRVRRRINQWLHIQYAKGDEFELVPHRLECQHNDVWCWDRAMVSSACRFLMRATGRAIFWK